MITGFVFTCCCLLGFIGGSIHTTNGILREIRDELRRQR